MRFPCGEQSVLLTRVGSAVYAVGGTCPHARGPLVEGVRQNDHVICPWHKASFCLRTGALVDPPAMDALPRFATRVAQGRVLVSVPPRNICDLTLQQCSDHPRFALTR
jgi:nitrite reductase/ring-hydroxylating ferredoxin subunit